MQPLLFGGTMDRSQQRAQLIQALSLHPAIQALNGIPATVVRMAQYFVDENIGLYELLAQILEPKSV